MKKKQLSIVSVLFVLSILVAGCNPAENISPSSIPTFTQIAAATNTSIPTIDLPASPTRLVGHWVAPYAGEDLPREIFLGELSSDGKGKLYLSNDFANYCERTYEVISEDEDTYIVRFYKGYTPKYADFSFQFMDDGYTLSYDGELLGEFTYADSETEPEALSTLAEKEAEYLTTTPMTGHWGHILDADGNIDENWQMYFGKINDDGEGIQYLSFESNVSKYTFKIVHEDRRDYDLRVQHECGGPDDLSRWEVSEDGQILNWIMQDEIYRFKFIDSNLEP